MANIPNKDLRELKETMNVFSDPRTQREAWRSLGVKLLNNPATKAPEQLDKDGNPTLASSIEQYTYRQLVNDIKRSEQPDREPTEIEMILACQMVKARFDTQAAIFVRDTLGAKPVDESKMDATLSANQYEQLSDEELELLAAHRAQKAADDQRSPAEASSSLVKTEDKHA
nr:MAG TPA: hypothetical protein [Caudoviricetes sp.]